LITLLHEQVEADWKSGIQMGAITLAETQRAIASIAPAFDPARARDAGEKAFFERVQKVASGKANATELRETLSELAVGEIFGRRRDGGKTEAGTVMRALHGAAMRATGRDGAAPPEVVPAVGKLRGFLQAVKTRFRGIFGILGGVRQAKDRGAGAPESGAESTRPHPLTEPLDRARAAGAGQDFHALIDKLTGRTDRAAQDAEAAPHRAERTLDAEDAAYAHRTFSLKPADKSTLAEVRAEVGKAGHSTKWAELPLREAERTEIEKLTGRDLSGFQRVVDASALRHVEKKHGPASKDATPITEADIQALPDILQSPIAATGLAADKGKNTQGIVSVRYHDGWFYHVEEVRTGQKALALNTLWKTKGPAPTNPAEASSNTSETLLREAKDRLARYIERDKSFSLSPAKLGMDKMDIDYGPLSEAEKAAGVSFSLSPFKPWPWIQKGFEKRIEAWEKTGTAGRDPINLGITPPVLRVAGAEGHQIFLPPSLLEKVTADKHQVPLEALRALPQELADPIAIFQSRTDPNSLVALTQYLEPGKGPIVLTVKLDKVMDRGVLINEVNSMYGRSAGNILEMFKDRVLYMDQEKSLDWARRAGLQLPGRGTLNQGLAKIAKRPDVVKWVEEQKRLAEEQKPPPIQAGMDDGPMGSELPASAGTPTGPAGTTLRSFAELKPGLENVVLPRISQIKAVKDTLKAARNVSNFSDFNFTKIQELERELGRHQEEARQEIHPLLVLPESAQTTVGIESQHGKYTRAMAFLRSLTHRDVLKGKNVEVRFDANSPEADPAGAYINGRVMRFDQVIHELGHIVEQRSRAALNKSLAFRDSRTQGERPKWLGAPHGADEMGFEDEWVKRGGRIYAGKVYRTAGGLDFASEILSVGVQRLWLDPAGFFADDPAYFEHIINTLRAP